MRGRAPPYAEGLPHAQNVRQWAGPGNCQASFTAMLSPSRLLHRLERFYFEMFAKRQGIAAFAVAVARY